MDSTGSLVQPKNRARNRTTAIWADVEVELNKMSFIGSECKIPALRVRKCVRCAETQHSAQQLDTVQSLLIYGSELNGSRRYDA